MKLDGNNHSVLLLYYHLVLVVKYRRKVFSDQMSQYAKDIFVRIGSSYNITLEEWITTKTMFISCFALIQIQNYQNSSMLIKVPAQG